MSTLPEIVGYVAIRERYKRRGCLHGCVTRGGCWSGMWLVSMDPSWIVLSVFEQCHVRQTDRRTHANHTHTHFNLAPASLFPSSLRASPTPQTVMFGTAGRCRASRYEYPETQTRNNTNIGMPAMARCRLVLKSCPLYRGSESGPAF